MLCVSSGFSPARTDEEAVNFIKEFEEAKGYTPDINVVLAYDAVNVLAQAIENCGSSDRTAIRDALREIQDFHAISGTVSFNENGDGGRIASCSGSPMERPAKPRSLPSKPRLQTPRT